MAGPTKPPSALPTTGERLRATLRPPGGTPEKRLPSSSKNPAVQAFRNKLQSIVDNTMPQLDEVASEIEEYAQRVKSDHPPAEDTESDDDKEEGPHE